MPENLVVVRGGGDLGTGTAWRLSRAGSPAAVLELPRPLTVRRSRAFSTAVTAGTPSPEKSEGVPQKALAITRGMAPFVVGLGPGLVAGDNCDAVVETNRGHHLGRVLWEGAAEADTGVPGPVGGESSGRVVRAAADGSVEWDVEIGELVTAQQTLGRIDEGRVAAPIAGVVRGLIAPGPVRNGLKIGDIDPRALLLTWSEISDKSLSVAGGVLEVVMTWLHQR